MSHPSASDSKRQKLSPMAQKTLEAIEGAFPVESILSHGDYSVLVEHTSRRWRQVLDALPFLNDDKGPWEVVETFTERAWECHIIRPLWDISSDFDDEAKTILPEKTLECMNVGADLLEMHILLPSPMGDYDEFCRKAMAKLGQMYKLSKWISTKTKELQNV